MTVQESSNNNKVNEKRGKVNIKKSSVGTRKNI